MIMLTPFREWAETSFAVHLDSIKASCAELVLVLEEEKDRLCRHPGYKQEAAGRYSQMMRDQK